MLSQCISKHNSQADKGNVGFEVFTAVTMKITVFKGAKKEAYGSRCLVWEHEHGHEPQHGLVAKEGP
jgi:hypothetical protein